MTDIKSLNAIELWPCVLIFFYSFSVFYKYKAFVFEKHLNIFSHLIMKDKTRIIFLH